MKRLLNVRKLCLWTVLGASSLALTIGTTCPVTGDNTRPVVPPGNRPPRIIITSLSTALGNNFAEVGDPVSIAFSGEDAEDAAVARIFASTSGNPTPAQEIPILGGFPIGPGSGNGVAIWDTTGFAPGGYNIFAEIDDRTLDPFTGTGNPPVRVTFTVPLQLGSPGSRPATSAPQLVFLSPTVNLGLSAQDELTLSYIYSDVDSTARITLLLDKDLIPTNDDINNPGDPADPASNIIILPSFPRRPDDPVFDGDVFNDPDNPIDEPDSLEIRTNPRVLAQTFPGELPFPAAPMAGELSQYIFAIDFALIPPRTQPYFIRATISDGDNTRHVYATGKLTVSAGGSGTFDLNSVGFGVAGARFQGFSARENLGSSFVSLGDIDTDGVEDFVIVGRYASPRNRPEVGAGYLVFGRKKQPFPVDTDGDGLPDGGRLDEMDNIINAPPPPDFVPDPYLPQNVGRFGGTISINSVGTFFRGTVYGMPAPFFTTPVPTPLDDPQLPGKPTAGLTSITAVQFTDDNVADLVFGTPFISTAFDFVDDDPVDGGCDVGSYPDTLPNPICDRGTGGSGANNDDLVPRASLVDQGMVCMADGSNDIRNIFLRFIDVGLAGQFDPNNPIDFEGVLRSPDQVPRGFRIRGGWFDNEYLFQGFFLGQSSNSEFGRTVAALPDISGDNRPELMISAPGLKRVTVDFSSFPPTLNIEAEPSGAVQVFQSGNYLSNIFRGTDMVASFPAYAGFGCTEPSAPGAADAECLRGFVAPPSNNFVVGEMSGDRFGNAIAGGDTNLDGLEDMLAGAPNADRNGLVDCGITYLLFVNAAGFGNIDMNLNPPPHLRITGTHNGDQFGLSQTGVDDMNGDGNPDSAIASASYDDAFVGVDAGFVGVLFGNPFLTGEDGFFPEDIGTPILNGVRFEPNSAGSLAGTSIASAGDFNADGAGDLLIACPGEVRCQNADGSFAMPVAGLCAAGTITRTGVGYLIFGGPHLDSVVNGRIDNVFSLSEVGSLQLPGLVMVGRVLPGTGPEVFAPIDSVGGVGDIDGDGFDDIFVASTLADFVNPANPLQRRINTGEAYLIYGNNFGPNHLKP